MTLNGTPTPPIATPVIEPKFVPVTATLAPIAPLSGLKEAMVGAGINRNPPKRAEPPGVVIATSPDAPEAPTNAVICVGETTVKRVAGTPPKLTAVASVKLSPRIVTTRPPPASAGVKPVITGWAINAKPALLPMPPGVRTETLPLVPCSDTTAVISVSETDTIRSASTPPNCTLTAPASREPKIEIVSPALAFVGTKEVIKGEGKTVKPPRTAVPVGVTTVTLPLTEFGARTAIICVGETTLKLLAGTPPKRTAVAPVKFAPIIVIGVPVPAEVGENERIVGAGINAKPASIAMPPGVVTATAPLREFAATTARISVSPSAVNRSAATPPKLTAEASVKCAPRISTLAPTPALCGEKLLISGAGTNVNPARVAEPAGVCTRTTPVAPLETTARICVGEIITTLSASTPPNCTERTLIKFAPLTVTLAPLPARCGVKLVISGGSISVNPARVARPVIVETDTFPLAPEPTTAIIRVDDSAVKRKAATPPKRTAVTPIKFIPVITTVSPAAAATGANEVIVGAGATNTKPSTSAKPPREESVTLPVEPNSETTARMSVSARTVNEAAVTPPKRTAVTPLKFAPRISTWSPGPPLRGSNDVIVGAGINMKPPRAITPAGVVTSTLPLAAPFGTTAMISVGETIRKLAAGTPPKLTAVAPERLAPIIRTSTPAPASAGEIPVIEGGVRKLNPGKDAVPPVVVTETEPVAPVPTTARISVGETTVKLAAVTPPKRTLVAPVKCRPRIITTESFAADAGEKPRIIGERIAVKPPILAEPPGLVTVICPLALTTARNVVSDRRSNPSAAIPPKVTEVISLKFVPVIVIVSPTRTLEAEKAAIVGGGTNVKPIILAEPPLVVIATLPLAPVLTTARISVGEATVKLAAGTSPKLAELTPIKFVPVIVTSAPAPALEGEKLVIVGGDGTKTKPSRVATPSGVVTDTAPLAPFALKTAVICVGEIAVNDSAGTPPKLTAVTLERFVPVIVTVAPGPALAGIKPKIVGAGKNIKPPSDAEPPGVESVIILPAAPGTTTVISVGETTVKLAAETLPKLTDVVPLKFVPVIVTIVPGSPLVGENPVIVGAGTNVKPASEATPPGVASETAPDAPAGATTAVICVGEFIVNAVAVTLPKVTDDAPVKFSPLILTGIPGPATAGVKLVITGGKTKVNPGKLAVPPVVVTITEPVAPVEIMAVICVGELTTKLLA